MKTSIEKRAVVVVGAGLAGLTAAYRLKTWGYDVHVYEARNRPGGRVCTAYFGSSHEELGGKNLHDGGEAPHIRALIREMGLSVQAYSVDISKATFLYKGTPYALEKLFIDSFPPTEELHQSLLAQTGVNLAEVINPLFLDSPCMRALMELFIRGYTGVSSDAVSAEYLDKAFWVPYKDLYETIKESKTRAYQLEEVQGGNSLLIEALANALGDRIHYNMPLRAINYDVNLQLQFGENHFVQASYAILAIPDSTLCAISNKFIPEDQWHAFPKRCYGTNAKMLIPCTNNYANTFHCTEEYVIWFDEQGDVATCYYGGNFGDFRKERIETIYERECTQLQNLHLQHAKNIVPIPMQEALKAHYEGPVYVSWICEEFSKGSYSSFTPACAPLFDKLIDYQGERLRNVYRPVKDILFFAGEQTAIEHPSTMEGAVESGEIAARLLKKMTRETHVNHS